MVEKNLRVVELEWRLAFATSRIAELETENAELLARSRRTSRDSNDPPSHDYDKPDPKSLRKPSGLKPGGQEQHEGATLERVDEPDVEIPHEPHVCECCGEDLTDAELVGEESRQVFDWQLLALFVADHLARKRRCQNCGHVSKGAFPFGVNAPVQYGPVTQTVGAYLRTYQHVASARACEALAHLGDAEMSEATLQGFSDTLIRTLDAAASKAGCEDLNGLLAQCLRGEPVVGFDETGLRVAGKLGWAHTSSSENYTLHTLQNGRGVEAIIAHGVLPLAADPDRQPMVAVHDGLKSYRSETFDCEHALCNAHHLRELVYILGRGPDAQAWAQEMGDLLTGLNDSVHRAKDAGKSCLSKSTLNRWRSRYMAIIARGFAENPDPERIDERGRIKQGKARNLLLRLQQYEQDVLRFAYDFRVPFTNNLTESDHRMVKTRLKVSGCFRSRDGAKRFLLLRSYLSTARKHGLDAFEVLLRVARGDPWLPPIPSAVDT